jgi:hypothetical protein
MDLGQKITPLISLLEESLLKKVQTLKYSSSMTERFSGHREVKRNAALKSKPSRVLRLKIE